MNGGVMDDHMAARGLGVNLDFADEPVDLDLGTIMSEGRRIRRWRTLAKATGAVGMAAAVFGMASVLRSGPGSDTPAAGGDQSPIASILAMDPPVVGPITIGTQPAHWTTVVWQTAKGQVCVASYRIPMQGATMGAECGDTVDAWLRTGDSGIGVPRFTSQPAERGAVPAIGIVRGDVARVDVSWSGLTSSATVYPFTTDNGERIGVYQVFMALPPGLDHFEGNQVDTLVAYDAAGNVVARHGQWTAAPQK